GPSPTLNKANAATLRCRPDLSAIPAGSHWSGRCSPRAREFPSERLATLARAKLLPAPRPSHLSEWVTFRARKRVTLAERLGPRPLCGGCGKKCRGYDTLDERQFDFVPLWAIPVVFLYCMRRVDCPRCGVKVEMVPWATGKSPLT